MPTTLVIVESPAKCKKIESYLGPGYKVVASFGHLRTISGLESIDVKNNFETKYSIIQEELKLKQVEKIRAEIAKADDVIIATDDDREGEAIGWHICDLFGLNVINVKRIIFHEITESAIQSAISHPKRINMDLVKAQQTRQILDLLVGFTISPILWNSVSNTSLSAGRCQTPALRLVYENYLDIKSSPGKIVYNTTGYFTNLNLLFELNKQFTSADICKRFLEQCIGWDFTCTTTSPKKVIKKAPEPLTTSLLQQLASNELNLSPKDTMKCAQQLYEGGYITYMRTDSKKYSNEFVESVKTYIRTYNGEQYISPNIDSFIVGTSDKDKETLNKKVKKTVAEKKGIPPPQEAHEAIRPVNISIRSPCVEDTLLTSKSLRLYDLIWKRTLESCMPSAQYNSISAKIGAPLDSEFVYKVEQVIFLGWQIVDIKGDSKSDKKDNSYQYISSLKQNIALPYKKIDSKFTMNELKSHYTEARLVQLLEEKGIGRPSTFASLVDKIQERKYAEKQNIAGKQIECVDLSLSNNSINELTVKKEFGNEKNKLVIQPLGIIVLEFLLSKFESFFNYDYTKQMEDNLDLISQGKYELVKTCNQVHSELTTAVDGLHELKKFSLVIDDDHTLIIGKHGPVIKCVSKKDPKNISFLPVKKDLDLQDLKHIPNINLSHVIDNNINNLSKTAIGKYKGQELFIKKGKYGIYAQWGKETKSLKEEFASTPIETINYIDVIKFLDKDTVLDPTKPVGFVRELNTHLSIRTGKYGDYIFYKKPYAKNPLFLKLNGFDSDYKKCDKTLLLNWIKQTYKVE
jgi:DNA topoisomerase-1